MTTQLFGCDPAGLSYNEERGWYIAGDNSTTGGGYTSNDQSDNSSNSYVTSQSPPTSDTTAGHDSSGNTLTSDIENENGGASLQSQWTNASALHIDAFGDKFPNPAPPNLPDSEYQAFQNVRPELVYVSQQPGADPGDYNDAFYAAQSAGQGELVYVVDTGYNRLSPVHTWVLSMSPLLTIYQDFAGRDVNCIISPDDKSNTPPDASNYCLDTDLVYIPERFESPSGNGHGTCMLSKVVGDSFGVAKGVTAIMARVTFPQQTASWNAAITAALNDFRQRKRNSGGLTHAVLSMSVYWPAGTYPKGYLSELRQLLMDMSSEGMLVVVPAGNTAEVSGLI